MMAYLCINNQNIECDGCGDCQENQETDYDDPPDPRERYYDDIDCWLSENKYF